MLSDKTSRKPGHLVSEKLCIATSSGRNIDNLKETKNGNKFTMTREVNLYLSIGLLPRSGAPGYSKSRSSPSNP